MNKNNRRNSKGVFIKTHGLINTSEYRSWCSMKKRCLNPDNDHLKYKNIPICDEWVKSFELFLKDMGTKPSNKHTIERIDNNKGYNKDNCKWATRSEQNRNYSQNKIIEYDGVSMCVTDWAEKLNIPRHRIFNRLQKGWNIEKALFYNLKYIS